MALDTFALGTRALGEVDPVPAGPEARISQQVVEVLTQNISDVRQSQQVVEVVLNTDLEARESQLVLEALFNTDKEARESQFILEVLGRGDQRVGCPDLFIPGEVCKIGPFGSSGDICQTESFNPADPNPTTGVTSLALDNFALGTRALGEVEQRSTETVQESFEPAAGGSGDPFSPAAGGQTSPFSSTDADRSDPFSPTASQPSSFSPTGDAASGFSPFGADNPNPFSPAGDAADGFSPSGDTTSDNFNATD